MFKPIALTRDHITPPSNVGAERRRRILVVEDDAMISMMLAGELADLGHEVVGPAVTVAQGFDLAASAVIDAALVDWSLKGVFAGDVAEMLTGRGIPFIFLTGYAATSNAHKDIDILSKPFLPHELRNAVTKLLSNAPIDLLAGRISPRGQDSDWNQSAAEMLFDIE
jgi:DNA-binding response OmpR family regulator